MSKEQDDVHAENWGRNDDGESEVRVKTLNVGSNQMAYHVIKVHTVYTVRIESENVGETA